MVNRASFFFANLREVPRFNLTASVHQLTRIGRMTLHCWLAAFFLFSTSPVAIAAPKSWTGTASALWSNPANWSPAGAPANGDDLYFPSASPHPNTTNDLTNLSVVGIVVNGTGNVLSGNAIILKGNLIAFQEVVVNLDIDIRADNIELDSFTSNGAIDINAAGVLLNYGQLNGRVDAHANDFSVSNVIFNGTLAGSGSLDLGGSLVINGSGTFSGTISGSSYLSDLYLNAASLPSATILSANLYGNGTVGAIFNSTVTPSQAYANSPGYVSNSTGIINSGNLQDPNLNVQINGASPGSGYTQINATGTITLVNSPALTVTLSPSFIPATGQQYIIVSNDGSDPIVGSFYNYPEGSQFTLPGGYQFKISYRGGDGNDIVLTCISAPRVWTGPSGGAWSQAANWANGIPQSGDAVMFPATISNITVNNDLSGLSLSGLTIAGRGITINGNALALAGPYSSVGGNTLNLPMDIRANDISFGDYINGGENFGGHVDINASGIRFNSCVFTAGVDVHGNSVQFLGGTLNGPLAGTGAISFSGTIGASGTYSGQISGFVNLNNASLPSASFTASISGNGTIGSFYANSAQPAQVYPFGGPIGNSVGVLNTGNLTLAGFTTFLITGPNPGTGYSQISTTGTVSINNFSTPLMLSISGFTPTPGQEFILVKNDGVDAVGGHFVGNNANDGVPLLEGTVFQFSGIRYKLSYQGGDGNDISLTALVSTPSTTTIASSLNPSAAGQLVTFTSVVSGNGPPPTGTVAFVDYNTTIATVPLTAAGRAVFATSSLAQGPHLIYAVYSGDATYVPSSASLGVQQVNAPVISISPATLPSNLVNTPYPSTNIIAGGGTAPYSFAVTSLSLPNGLTLSSSGVLSGTPTVVGTFNFDITATDAHFFSGARAYSITITSVPTTIAQTITFANPGAQTTGGTLNLSASSSSGLVVAFSSLTTSVCTVSGATATFVGIGSCTIAADQVGNANYSAAPRVTQTFTVNPALLSQSINFSNPGTQVAGGTVSLVASASSGLQVVFSSLSTSVCTVSGSTASLIAAGTCTIAADQGGNSAYSPASRAIQAFAVNAAVLSQTITFANPGTRVVGQPLNLAASSTSGLTVTFSSLTPSVCTVNGTAVSFITAGTCTIAADQAGNAGFSAAPRVNQTFTVNAAPQSQTINFANPGVRVAGSSLALVATASSGLAVTFSSQTPAICTITGSSANLVSAGNCTIAADQSGNAQYLAAPQVIQTFTVNAAIQAQSITFGNPGTQTVGSTVNLSASATSGLPVSFSSLTPSVCSIVGNVASLAAPGSCSIAADQAGNNAFSAASRVTQSFQVNATVPGAPTGLACQAGILFLSCGFAVPASNGGAAISRYTLTCSPQGGGSFVVVTGTSSPITVSNLQAGVVYTCSVTATNSVGVGPSSASSNAVAPLPAGGLPPAPSMNRAIAGNTRVTVAFTTPDSNGGSTITRYTATSSPGGISSLCNVPCSSIVVSGLTNGTSYTFTVTATNSSGTGPPSGISNAATPLSTNPTGTPIAPLAQRGGMDIDGNGRGQIIVRNGSTGQLQIGRLVGTQWQFTPSATIIPTYRPVGIGDFDGNGKSDYVFQDTTQGELGDVLLYPNFSGNATQLLRSVKLPWIAEAVADMDGDGYSDIVFRFTGDDGIPNDTGVSYIWFMNGSTVKQVRKRGGAPLNWTLLGAADINGDYAADMVYISPNNDLRVLIATPQRTCANLSAGTLPAGYQALKLADFTGKGRADILYRHPTTGATALLSLDASAVTLPAPNASPDDPNASCSSSSLVIPTSSINLPAVDPTWQLYSTGDFNGDGYVDIVWKQPNGILTMWLMGANSAGPTIIANAGSAPSGYTVIQP